MTIVLLVEGKTETAIREVLKQFPDQRAEAEGQPRVRLRTKPMDSRLLRPERVHDQVLLSLRDPEVVCVIGMVDVYPNFASAQAAKLALGQAVGQQARFHAHAAQFEVEAWLLPYWGAICQRLRVHRQAPGGQPEQVNLQRPPSRHLRDLYRAAGRDYDKPRDAKAILDGKDLTVAANACPELKALLNTLLGCAGLTAMP